MSDAPKLVLVHAPAEPLPALKPMATAPRERRVLALDECLDGGQLIRKWRIVYWCDAFDDMPAGWRGNNWGDLRTPLGWLMAMPDCGVPDSPVDYELGDAARGSDVRALPRHGWTCFHCTEHFPGTPAGKIAAAEHFGPTEDWSPLCIERKTLNGDALLKMSREARVESQRFLVERHEAINAAAKVYAPDALEKARIDVCGPDPTGVCY